MQHWLASGATCSTLDDPSSKNCILQNCHFFTEHFGWLQRRHQKWFCGPVMRSRPFKTYWKVHTLSMSCIAQCAMRDADYLLGTYPVLTWLLSSTYRVHTWYMSGCLMYCHCELLSSLLFCRENCVFCWNIKAQRQGADRWQTWIL